MTGSGLTDARGPRVVLIGFMGSGKSTVGQQLARVLGCEWKDSDVEIERRSGRTIPEIFADGEEVFRDYERQVVADLLGTVTGVLSLGGGAVLSQATRDLLAGHPVVYLRVGADQGFSRVANSSRPLLKTDNPKQVYRDLLARRDPIYRDAATFVVDAHPHQRVVADKIITQLTEQEATQ
ncbi:UNVERIFIED_CONTAM: shikimate kinase [Williamsia faeni]